MNMKDAMSSQVINPSNDAGIDRGKQFIPNNKNEIYHALAQPADAKALAPNISQADREDIEAAYGKSLDTFLLEHCSSDERRPTVWIRGDDALGMCGLIEHNGQPHIWMVARDDYQVALPQWLRWPLQNGSLLFGPLNAITRSNREGRRALFKSLGMSFVGIDTGGAVYQYDYSGKHILEN